MGDKISKRDDGQKLDSSTPLEERLEDLEVLVEYWEGDYGDYIPEDRPVVEKISDIILRQVRSVLEDEYYKDSIQDMEKQISDE